ncbi:MAG: uridine diphosphate-N-acetylglucosamine-binding protein YvcK [Synergistota bacterium]|nr:uridine diphosphate-N-acetylglucosamine-binding protein YvcK [Synergistota bacterium]
MDLLFSYILGLMTVVLLAAFFWPRSGKRIRAAIIGGRQENKTPMTKAIEYRLSMGPLVAALGGGTGLSTLLRGLKCFTRNIVAVVTVTDEGGSSGRLREEWGVLPPGDVRNCIVALAENDNALRSMLDFRFDRGGLAGHSLGNLMLLAITEQYGDFRRAVEEMNHLLAIRGRVLPVTTESVSLVAETRGGVRVKGELSVSDHGYEIEKIWLEPKDAKPLKDVLRSLDEANIIVLGPGSLFTSIIPNLLIKQVADNLRQSEVPKVYIANLMTQPLETQGFNILDHVRWISAAMGAAPDYILVNDGVIPETLVAKYLKDGAEPLYISEEEEWELEKMGCRIIRGDFVRIMDGDVVRHNGQALSEIIMRLCRELEEV